jgi:hypothetical protein
MSLRDPSDSRFAFVLVKSDAELSIEIARPNEIIVWVGVPSGWISEEPSHSITLSQSEARRVGEAFRAAADIGP